MKNSGDGGPVGTLSEIASVCDLGGRMHGMRCVFDFQPTGISETLASRYLIGCCQRRDLAAERRAHGHVGCGLDHAKRLRAGARGVDSWHFDQGQKLDDVPGWAAETAAVTWPSMPGRPEPSPRLDRKRLRRRESIYAKLCAWPSSLTSSTGGILAGG